MDEKFELYHECAVRVSDVIDHGTHLTVVLDPVDKDAPVANRGPFECASYYVSKREIEALRADGGENIWTEIKKGDLLALKLLRSEKLSAALS